MVADEQDLERIEEEDPKAKQTGGNLEDEDIPDEIDADLDDDIDEDLVALDTDDDLDEDETPAAVEEEEDEEDVAVVEDSDSTSLEELLARRTAARRGTDDSDEDEDFIALSSEAARVAARAKSKVAPLRNREEFVCKKCFLLKPKVQLADAERMLCRDCV